MKPAPAPVLASGALPRHAGCQARARRLRGGFTLIEILISLMIFSIVSVAMVTIMLTSTNLFKAGEAGRSTTDEAVAALGVIDEDLRRMVSGRDGGVFYSALHDPVTGQVATNTGDCAVAFEISQPNPALVEQSPVQSQGSVGARLLVLYFVELPPAGSPLPQEELLYRLQAPILSDALNGPVPPALSFAPNTVPTSDVQFIEQLLNPATRALWTGVGGSQIGQPAIVARRALHFGAWISTELNPRLQSGNWTTDTGTASAQIPPAPIPPTATVAYSTQLDAGAAVTTTASPFPTAVLFTLVLSSGRFAPAGRLIADLGGTPEQYRIGGISALPVVPGAKLRIGTEWVQYSGYSGGVVTLDQNAPGQGRGALRSTPNAANTPRDTPVAWGSSFSLGRIFPH